MELVLALLARVDGDAEADLAAGVDTGVDDFGFVVEVGVDAGAHDVAAALVITLLAAAHIPPSVLRP